MAVTAFLTIGLAASGCERKQPSSAGTKSEARKAVEEVITQDFKIYENAKKTLGKIERDSEERQKQIEKETE